MLRLHTCRQRLGRGWTEIFSRSTTTEAKWGMSKGEKMQLNAGAVFGHYSEQLAEAKSFAGKVVYLLASQIAPEVSWRGFRSLPALFLCGILGRLLQLGSFQLFPFSILAYSLNKENKMKAFKDKAVFHKQMQNKAQEILSKVKNECCLFKAYLEWVSLFVDRSEASHSPNCNCNAR